MNKLFVIAAVLCAWVCNAQPVLKYTLTYAAPGDSSVQVRIDMPRAATAPTVLIMPRNYPGGYEFVPYDSFVEDVKGFSANGTPLEVKRASIGPRWKIGKAGDNVAWIQYSVNIARMEKEILGAVDSSKVRPRYLGLLGYSVFAYIEGMEEARIELLVNGPADWPVYTTIAPMIPAPVKTTTESPANFYELADSEVLMGPDLQLHQYNGAINLVMAVYTEGDADLKKESELARKALDRVQNYYGDTPFHTYTVELEFLKPLPEHEYRFSQEHLDSGTFSFSTQEAITAATTAEDLQNKLGNYAHHMAHSWIPKRAYGEGYMPFEWEMPPSIDTIWFNEGIGRYAAIAALTDGMSAEEAKNYRSYELDYMRESLEKSPAFIKRMSTVVLSREASFLYAKDFRTGINIFSRGALMAAEMDERIRAQTGGKKDLRDCLRAIVKQTQEQKRPFKIEELPPLFQQASGVDVSDIFERWMQPQVK